MISHLVLSFSSSTLPSPENTTLTHPSLSLHAMIMSSHLVQRTPSTASSQDRPSVYHLSTLGGTCCAQFSTFPSLRVNQLIESQLLSCLPPDFAPPDRPPPDRTPPCIPPISIKHRLQVFRQTRSISASKCIAKLPRSRPRSASLCSLHHGFQVYIQTRLITASKFPRSWPLQTGSVTSSKYFSKLTRSWCGETADV